MSVTSQAIYTGDTIVYVGENGTSGDGSTTTNKHTLTAGPSSNTVVGPFYAVTLINPRGTFAADYCGVYDFAGTLMGDLVPRQTAASQVLVSKKPIGATLHSKAWANGPEWIRSMITNTDGTVSLTYNSETNLLEIAVNGSELETEGWAQTMPPATAGTVHPSSYTSDTNKYKAFGSMFTVGSRMTFKPTDLAYTKLIQGSFTNAVLAIYRVKSLTEMNVGTLVCHGDFFSVSNTGLVSANFTQSNVTLDPSHIYYAVLFSKDNGWRVLGSWRQGSVASPDTAADTLPYICPILDHITISDATDIDNNLSEITWGGYEQTNISQLWVFRKV